MMIVFISHVHVISSRIVILDSTTLFSCFPQTNVKNHLIFARARYTPYKSHATALQRHPATESGPLTRPVRTIMIDGLCSPS